MIAGRYALDREIGRGGMGAVWLGRDEVLGRDVAIKRLGLAPGGSANDLERAEREARLAARLNHPHVVAVYDLVLEDHQQWLVMEYVEGLTLSALVQRDGALAPDEAAPIIRQAADALAAAHTAGIVHRDVKPSNILVTPAGQVKLSDFGIARAEADASLTQTGLVTGSPAYLSPEVATGRQATSASDVWSLGATLFHALAGHPPYEVGDNVLGALYRIVHEDPPRLGTAGWLTPLLEATMTLEPKDRWSMAQVRDFLTSGPGTTPPPVPRTRVVPAPVAAAHETQVLSTGAPTPVTPAAAPSRRSHGAVIGVALAIAALAVVALLAWMLGSDSDGEPNADPTPTSSGANKTTTPSSPAATPAEVTADGMENFVEGYLATVTSDPKAAWEQLTPQFQAASGGFGQYQRFWATIQTADLLSAQADPKSRQISYTVEYLRPDGSKTQDQVTLTLQGTDEDYLIADES